MTRERQNDVISMVVTDIYARFREPMTVADMAHSARYSKFHFTRMFQRAVGIPPGRFLTAVRIQEAKRLLLSTPLSVGEIAARVGYSSIGTFSAKFKSSVGLSPTDYRDVARYAGPASGSRARNRP